MRRVGLIVTLASLGYFLLSLQVLHPAFGGAAEASMALHFGHLGGSPFGVVRALLTAPGQVLEHFIARERLVYLPLVLGPLALLPLARPALVLVALPPLALNLLSQFPTATQLYSHYLTPALPPLFVGAVLALSGRPRPGRRSGLLMLCATTLIATLLWGGLPWSRDFAAADFRDDPRSAAHRRLLARIEPGRPVQAPDALLPHLAERRRVHRAPPPERETGLVVLDLGHRRRFAAREVLLRTAEEPLARTWLARTDHGVIDAAGDLVLLERGADPRAGVARRYLLDGPNYGAAARLTGCLEITLGLLEPRQLSLLLRALGPCPEDLAVRLGTGAAPPRVDLLFDGLLSPAHLRAGDSLRSVHAISGAERRAIGAGGLRVGALRSSGARPAPADPIAVDVRVVWPPTSAPAARVPLRPEPASRSDEARLP